MSEVRFGPYRIVETLGSGAFSTIYKAVQEPLGRVVVLKALKTQISPSSSFGEQLEWESKILVDLLHPNIVVLLDSARSDAGRPYLVLEHIDGPPLATMLAKKKKLSVEAALAIAIGIASALGHAHERGIVHRDVKPSNVLLAKSGIVKIADFGIAQRVRAGGPGDGTEEITPSGRAAAAGKQGAYGTPAYMSPEQILGDFVDERSDLYSLGVVLYQLLSGTRPFEAPGESYPPPPGQPVAGDREARRTRREAPLPLRDRAPEVPRGVERIVMRLLEKSPDDRYPTAALVRERLVDALRAITREEPALLVRDALADAGFVKPERRPGTPSVPPVGRAAPVSLRMTLAGQALVLLVFLGAIAAIESPSSSARDGGKAGAQPLELVPERAGGLRVVATPWAHVRVDGQEVETTPFARAIPLSAGKHWATLVHPDAPPVERELDVVAGEIVTLDVTMAVGELDGGKDAR